MIDASPNTASSVTPEVMGLLAQLEVANARAEEAETKARQAEISLQLSDMRVTSLLEQIRLLRIAKYGPRGESLSAAQLALFEQEPSATLDEVAAEAARGPLPEPTLVQAHKRRKNHPGRQTLPRPARTRKARPLARSDPQPTRRSAHCWQPAEWADEIAYSCAGQQPGGAIGGAWQNGPRGSFHLITRHRADPRRDERGRRGGRRGRRRRRGRRAAGVSRVFRGGWRKTRRLVQ